MIRKMLRTKFNMDMLQNTQLRIDNKPSSKKICLDHRVEKGKKKMMKKSRIALKISLI